MFVPAASQLRPPGRFSGHALVKERNADAKSGPDRPFAIGFALGLRACRQFGKYQLGCVDAHPRRRGGHALPHDGQIQAVDHDASFEFVEVQRLGRQIGETAGDLPGGLLAPQSEQRVDSFAPLQNHHFSRSDRQPGLLVQRPLVGQRQVRNVAGLMQSPGPIVRCFGRTQDLAVQMQRLLGGLKRNEGPFGARDRVQHHADHFRFRHLQLGSGQAFSQGDQEYVEDILDGSHFENIVGAGTFHESKGYIQHGVAQQSGLNHLGLRDPQTFVGRLQPPIVQQGNANRLVEGQVVTQHLFDL